MPPQQQPASPSTTTTDPQQQQRARRREWNRGPLTDLFPRMPDITLERILDILIDDKNFTYNLSASKWSNARRYTALVVAHCRHAYSEYDALLVREGVERFEARRRTAERVWGVLRTWSPWWERDNEVLERCFRATLGLEGEVVDPMVSISVSNCCCCYCCLVFVRYCYYRKSEAWWCCTS
jgi:hypothetical protein